MDVFTSSLALALLVNCLAMPGTAQGRFGLNPEAEVEMVRAPPSGGDSKSTDSPPCNKPRTIKGLFRYCGTETGRFPAHQATCTCLSCTTELDLTCFPDGKWYSNNSRTCAPPGVHCGLCKEQDLPRAVRCSRPTFGYLGEVVSCSCRNNCMTKSVRCERGGTWRYLETPDVCTETILDLESTSSNLHVSHEAGTFTYTCSPGYTLQGPSSVRCQDGQFSSKPPTCRPGSDELETVQSTTEISSEDMSQNTITMRISDTKTTIIISISILTALFGIGLVIMMILWCKKSLNNAYITATEVQSCPNGTEMSTQQPCAEPAYLEPLSFNSYNNTKPMMQAAKQETKFNDYVGMDGGLYEEIGAMKK